MTQLQVDYCPEPITLTYERDNGSCTSCQYEIEHEGKKVCRTMTRTHGQPCDAFKERKE